MLNDKIKFSKTSPEFSRIVTGVWKWGTWGAKLDIGDITKLIESSVHCGVSSFDHADIYGDYLEEERFGRALKQSSVSRDKIEIISKCGIKLLTPNRPSHSMHSYNTTKKHILLSVDNSLRSLGIDYLDLLLIHRPSPLMSPEIIAEAFDTLKQAGKVRSFGVSNFTPEQFETQLHFTDLVTNQVEVSLAKLGAFRDGTILQSQKHGLRPMAWSPLGGGSLMRAAQTEQEQRIATVAEELCAKYECEKSQLYIAFLLNHPAGIVPILGTSKALRIVSATRAAEIILENDDWFRLWVASTGEDLP